MLERLVRLRVDLLDVLAVDVDRVHAPRLRALGHVVDRRVLALRRRLGPAVVLAHEDGRDVQSCARLSASWNVPVFVEPSPKKATATRGSLAELERERGAGDRRQPAADDGVRAEVAALDVVEVHRAAVAVRAALDLPVELGHHRVRRACRARACARARGGSTRRRRPPRSRGRRRRRPPPGRSRRAGSPGSSPARKRSSTFSSKRRMRSISRKKSRSSLLGARCAFLLDLRHGRELVRSLAADDAPAGNARLVEQWRGAPAPAAGELGRGAPAARRRARRPRARGRAARPRQPGPAAGTRSSLVAASARRRRRRPEGDPAAAAAGSTARPRRAARARRRRDERDGRRPRPRAVQPAARGGVGRRARRAPARLERRPRRGRVPLERPARRARAPAVAAQPRPRRPASATPPRSASAAPAASATAPRPGWCAAASSAATPSASAAPSRSCARSPTPIRSARRAPSGTSAAGRPDARSGHLDRGRVRLEGRRSRRRASSASVQEVFGDANADIFDGLARLRTGLPAGAIALRARRARSRRDRTRAVSRPTSTDGFEPSTSASRPARRPGSVRRDRLR